LPLNLVQAPAARQTTQKSQLAQKLARLIIKESAHFDADAACLFFADNTLLFLQY